MSTPNPMEELKAGLPDSKWGKILGATPIVMTVIATLLAGLSNSEMTKAQYARALAAQQQSKAGDQWAFFQAKRMRSAIQLSTLDVVQFSEITPQPDGAALREFAGTLPYSAGLHTALEVLLSGKLPEAARSAPPAREVQAILDAMRNSIPEEELFPLLNAAEPEVVVTAIRLADADIRAFDEKLNPVIDGGDKLGEAIDASGQQPLRRDFARLRLSYSAMRYDAEAALNRAVASLLEVQVRQSNIAAERHYRRSMRFFYGMLAAQAAVIVSTFAMAARKRNLLWSL
ncbi:MAG TPA: DUF4337 family protein, partial [Opitutaceae bacterium]|nr:DUF4337 family protein [Opitutaceae bacterium]